MCCSLKGLTSHYRGTRFFSTPEFASREHCLLEMPSKICEDMAAPDEEKPERYGVKKWRIPEDAVPSPESLLLPDEASPGSVYPPQILGNRQSLYIIWLTKDASGQCVDIFVLDPRASADGGDFKISRHQRIRVEMDLTDVGPKGFMSYSNGDNLAICTKNELFACCVHTGKVTGCLFSKHLDYASLAFVRGDFKEKDKVEVLCGEDWVRATITRHDEENYSFTIKFEDPEKLNYGTELKLDGDERIRHGVEIRFPTNEYHAIAFDYPSNRLLVMTAPEAGSKDPVKFKFIDNLGIPTCEKYSKTPSTTAPSPNLEALVATAAPDPENPPSETVLKQWGWACSEDGSWVRGANASKVRPSANLYEALLGAEGWECRTAEDGTSVWQRESQTSTERPALTNPKHEQILAEALQRSVALGTGTNSNVTSTDSLARLKALKDVNVAGLPGVSFTGWPAERGGATSQHPNFYAQHAGWQGALILSELDRLCDPYDFDLSTSNRYKDVNHDFCFCEPEDMGATIETLVRATLESFQELTSMSTSLEDDHLIIAVEQQGQLFTFIGVISKLRLLTVHARQRCGSPLPGGLMEDISALQHLLNHLLSQSTRTKPSRYWETLISTASRLFAVGVVDLFFATSADIFRYLKETLAKFNSGELSPTMEVTLGAILDELQELSSMSKVVKEEADLALELFGQLLPLAFKPSTGVSWTNMLTSLSKSLLQHAQTLPLPDLSQPNNHSRSIVLTRAKETLRYCCRTHCSCCRCCCCCPHAASRKRRDDASHLYR